MDESPKEKTSREQTSEPPDSCHKDIRTALVVWGELFGRAITPALVGAWCKVFGECDPQKLGRAIQRCTLECKFFPVPADVYSRMSEGVEEKKTIEAEQSWQRALNFAREFGNLPDGVTIPQLERRMLVAANAAGGVNYIESCSIEDLVWAKKRFLETWNATVKIDEIEALEGGFWSEIKAIGEGEKLQ